MEERKLPKKKKGDMTFARRINEECPTGCGMHSLMSDNRIIWCSYVKCNYWRFVKKEKEA
jgi:hypothetical protein